MRQEAMVNEFFMGSAWAVAGLYGKCRMRLLKKEKKRLFKVDAWAFDHTVFQPHGCQSHVSASTIWSLGPYGCYGYGVL